MSDPVSNAEIEDVLSSIRRLVSEDPSPLSRRKRVAEGAKERFVLTPALRVSEDAQVDAAEPAEGLAPDAGESPLVETAGAEQHAPEETGDTPPTDHAEEAPDSPEAVAMRDRFSDSRQTLEQRIAELEAALQQSPEEWEPDGSEVARDEGSTIPDIADAPDSEETDGQAELVDWIDEPEEAEADASDEDRDPSEDFAEVSEAVFEALDEAEPVETLDEDAVEPTGSADPVAEADVPFEAEPEEADDGLAAPHPADLRIMQPVPEQDLQDEALETPGADDPQDTDLYADDSVAAEASDLDDDDEPSSFELFEDAVLDEEALRDMVSQLVRDELQGVLGERITRNVRRLVRREIQRAIAMRELE